jgi:hypothetical protein
MSSDEMSIILERCGARVVARTDHGLLFAANRHLILIRHCPVVAANDLGDIVRSASIAPARLSELLAEVRSEKKQPSTTTPG